MYYMLQQCSNISCFLFVQIRKRYWFSFCLKPDNFLLALLNVTFTFVFYANGLAMYVTTCTLSSLSRRRVGKIAVTSQRVHVTKQVAGQKHARGPGLLVVCVSCKIHSPRISQPAPCKGFSPSRVAHKDAFRGHTEKRRLLVRTSVRTKTPRELVRRITSGVFKERRAYQAKCREVGSWAGQEMQGARIRVIEPQ